MSDVAQGGATVFPNVGARIPPGNVRTFLCSLHLCIVYINYRVMQHSGGTLRDLEKETTQHDMQLAQY